MPLPPIVVAGGIAAASAGGQAIAAGIGNKKRIQAAKEAATLANQRNIENWERQNAYNDPSAQMARLNAAGLNPNMVYGTGTQAAGQAGNLPSAPAPVPQIRDIPVPSGMDMLGQYQNIQLAKARESETQASEMKKYTEIAINITRNSIMGYEEKSASRFYTNRSWDMANKRRISSMNAQEAEYRINNLENVFAAEMKNAQAKADYQRTIADWAKAGITTSDSTISRLTYSIMMENGQDPRNTILAAAVAKEVAILATGLGVGKLIGGSKKGINPTNKPKPPAGWPNFPKGTKSNYEW